MLSRQRIGICRVSTNRVVPLKVTLTTIRVQQRVDHDQSVFTYRLPALPGSVDQLMHRRQRRFCRGGLITVHVVGEPHHRWKIGQNGFEITVLLSLKLDRICQKHLGLTDLFPAGNVFFRGDQHQNQIAAFDGLSVLLQNHSR